jgi:hypothetical protein
LCFDMVMSNCMFCLADTEITAAWFWVFPRDVLSRS